MKLIIDLAGILLGIATAALANLIPWWLSGEIVCGEYEFGFPLTAFHMPHAIMIILIEPWGLFVDGVFALGIVWTVHRMVTSIWRLGPRHYVTKLRRWGTVLDDDSIGGETCQS